MINFISQFLQLLLWGLHRFIPIFARLLHQYTNIINHLNQQIMTKTLKPICPETPILYGEDARRFLKKIKNPTKLSDERRKEIMGAYQAAMSVYVD